MILISANPGNRPKPYKAKVTTKENETMAKKARSVAQKRATANLMRYNKSRKRHTNPSKRTRKAIRRSTSVVRHTTRRRVLRNPSMFAGGGVLKELLSMDGALMIGAAFAAPMVADFVQEKFVPNVTGYMKIAVKAAVIGAGAWAIAKFAKKPKVALAFGVTGAAVLVADVVKTYRGTLTGLSADQAELLGNAPQDVRELVMQGYSRGLADNGGGYQYGLADQFDNFSNAFPGGE